VTDRATEHPHWEPHHVYFQGDVVTDALSPAGGDGSEAPTAPGRFRALIDHYSGLLGPRFLEVDHPGVWERIETL
jgi:hypothetical protein